MASSSGRPQLLFLWPISLDPKTAWVVSGFRTLATTHDGEKCFACVSQTRWFRLCRPTDEGLQHGLRTLDELVVNLLDQVAQNLLVL